MRQSQSTTNETREQTLQAIYTQIDRLDHMNNVLYNDKFAGEISREVYEAKHAKFMAQKAELGSQAR